MEQSAKKSSRKKFLIWSGAALSSIGLLKFLKGSKSVKTDTVKMLTQDGKLVEIDKRLLANVEKKASIEELQQFVKKN